MKPEIDPPKADNSEHDAERQMRRLSRRALIWSAVAVGGTYGFFWWLDGQPKLQENDVIWPLRDALTVDDRITKALYSPGRLSPTYDDSAITEARENGDVGLDDTPTEDTTQPTDRKAKPGSAPESSPAADDSTDVGFDPKNWSLIIQGHANPKIKTLKIEDIKAFTRHEFVTEFKCIEGWSYFMKWAGARLSDFIAKYPPAMRADYVALETPDGQYYVSIDMPAAMHPQTLLAYEMNGKPLELEHGAPLRLIIPHKYGVKNLKRIGKLTYAERPPKDYWAEMGYDYYAGL